MSMTKTLSDKQHQVESFRAELNQVQDALAQADGYLSKTDEALIGAQEVAQQTRRLAPALGIAIAVTTAVVVVVFVVRRRKAQRED